MHEGTTPMPQAQSSARRIEPNPTCSVDGCTDAGTKRGMCNSHYRAQIRTGRGPCSADGCNTTWQVAGLCLKHYHRQRRYGTTDDPEPTPPLGACSADGCDETVKSRGMCGMHYARDQRAKYGTCTIDGCASGAVNRKGVCAKHYARTLAHGTTDDPPPRRKQPLICTVEGCDNLARARGWCSTRWKRWRQTGTTDDPGPAEQFTCGRCKKVFPRARYDPAEGYCPKCSRLARNARNRFRAYRIYASDAEAAAARQGDFCAICGVSQDQVKRQFSADHDHQSGRFRGLLCGECNLGLGKFHDDPHILEIAAAYLRNE
jgi:hypothetical protein